MPAIEEEDHEEDLTPLLSVDDEMRVVASNDEWVFRRADTLQKRLPARTGGPDRKTEAEVFDRPTLMALHRLLTHGVLKSLDFPVSTGKEANVFRGTTPRGAFVAVKIYRVNTATFKHVLRYIQGDERFEGKSGDKRSLVHSWCQKEFRNLARYRDAGVDVPEPLKALSNVLVTEYLGTREGPWPRLQELRELPEAERLYRELVDAYVKGYNEADLVHADLSEYNVLVAGTDGAPPTWRPRIIDVGQSVLKNHPMAREFLERDIANLVRYFARHGVAAQASDVIGRLVHERKQERERLPSRRQGFGTRGDEEE